MTSSRHADTTRQDSVMKSPQWKTTSSERSCLWTDSAMIELPGPSRRRRCCSCCHYCRRCTWKCLSVALFTCLLGLCSVVICLLVLGHDAVNELSLTSSMQLGRHQSRDESHGTSDNSTNTAAPERCYLLGERLAETLAAWQFWRTCVNISQVLSDHDDVNSGPHKALSRDGDVTDSSPLTLLTVWNISAVSHSTSSPLSLVVYARRRLPPTHVRYDVRHTLTTAPTYVTSFLTSVTSMTSEKLTTPTARRRLPRDDVINMAAVSLKKRVRSGVWFVYFYNDSPTPQTTTFSLSAAVRQRVLTSGVSHLVSDHVERLSAISPKLTDTEADCSDDDDDDKTEHQLMVTAAAQPSSQQNDAHAQRVPLILGHGVFTATLHIAKMATTTATERQRHLCDEGWDGSTCDNHTESVCQDNVDNDADGLVDCADPGCCRQAAACIDSPLCRTAPDPLNIVLRKQPPSPGSTFYDRVKFLVDDDSVQSYADRNSFQRSRVSVVRGRVLDVHGAPLVGVRVSVVTHPLYGFTLTRRPHGEYDLLVNGGGTVSLLFQRGPPFVAQRKNVMVRSNSFVVVDRVTLLTAADQQNFHQHQRQNCLRTGQHDAAAAAAVAVMSPSVNVLSSSSSQHHTSTISTLSCYSALDTLRLKSQVVVESVPMPGNGTNVSLVYASNRAPGYKSTLVLRLTSDHSPVNLTTVHVYVSVEGRQTRRMFAARPNLRYTFTWNRLNAYRQKVYGRATAIVRVGYEYRVCIGTVVHWRTLTTSIPAHDMQSSQIGGWNFDVHHAYNFHQGIVHRGDGSNVHVARGAGHVMTPLLGNTTDRRQMAPVRRLASALDGSLFIGDSRGVIRKLAPSATGTDRQLTDVLQLNVSLEYYMTIGPVDGCLYVSDTYRLRVLRLTTDDVRSRHNVDAASTSRHRPVAGRANVEVVAGSGETCVPGTRSHCGDGQLAVEAALSYPKGLAVDKEGVLYIADGVTLRTVDQRGRIATVVGSQAISTSWRPLLCHQNTPASQVTLRWPTSLAINPMDQSVYILDGDVVIQLSPSTGSTGTTITGSDGHSTRLSVIMAVSANVPCIHMSLQPHRPVVLEGGRNSPEHRRSKSVSLRDIAVTASGQRLLMVDQDTSLHALDLLTGHVTMTSCRRHGNASSGGQSALAISHDDIVYVTDGGADVYAVTSRLPTPHHVTGNYDVIDPIAHQRYTFNRYGQHVATYDVTTGALRYKFTYNVNSDYGRLTRVTDLSANTSIVVRRDYRLQARHITVVAMATRRGPGQSRRQQRCHVTADSNGLLASLTTPGGVTWRFSYMGDTGLLTSRRRETKVVHRYKYGPRDGRVISVVYPPTGTECHFTTS